MAERLTREERTRLAELLTMRLMLPMDPRDRITLQDCQRALATLDAMERDFVWIEGMRLSAPSGIGPLFDAGWNEAIRTIVNHVAPWLPPVESHP